MYLYDLEKRVGKRDFGELFCPVSQQVQINFKSSDNVRILFLSCNVNSQKTTAKLSKRAETSIVLFVFGGVLIEVRAYAVTVSYRGST